MDHTSWDFDTQDGQPSLSVDDILFEFNQEQIPKQFKELPGFQKLTLSGRPGEEAESVPVPEPEAHPQDGGSAGEAASQADIDAWLKGSPDTAPESADAVLDSADDLPAEDEPEASAPRRREEKRSLFSFFGRKKAPPAAVEEYPEEEEPEEDNDASFSSRPAESAPVTHSGSIGRMEQEARSYIAQMQAESGVPSRRERESAAAYTYDLDDLLGIRPEPEEAAPQAQEAAPVGDASI